MASQQLWEKVLEYGETQKDKPAVIAGNELTTYGQLADKVRTAQMNLLALGVKEQEAVLFSAPSRVEYIVAYLALLGINAIAVPLHKSASYDEVKYILDLTKAHLILTDHPKLKEIPHSYSLNHICNSKLPDSRNCAVEISKTGETEISEILFTSGTTGKPKGVVLSKAAIAASIYNTATGIGMRQEDVLLLPLPLNHSFGMRVLRSALYNGETIVLQNGFSFAKELIKNIEVWHCNCMACVNAGFEMIRQQISDEYIKVLGKLRYIEFSAGAVPVSTRKLLRKKLPDTLIYNTWGSTETGGALFLDISNQEDKLETAGRPINDIAVKIVDEDGKEITQKKNVWGRLAIKGTMLLSGYYRDQQMTEMTLKEGWFYTSDCACIDEDGYVRLNGRIDDVINVGGEKVAPADVEKLVLASGMVRECACIGVEDPEQVLGQVAVVYVVAGNDYDEKKVIGHIRENAASYMVPYRLVKVRELPLNYMGKLDRKELRKRWLEYDRDNGVVQLQSEPSGFAADVLQLISTRRTIRNFTEQRIEKEKVEDILLAGRMAPSGHNMQTWQFTVVDSRRMLLRIKEITEKTAKEKGTLFYGYNNPQILIIVSNDRRNAYGCQDSSAAIENMLLMAHAHGLGTCWINALLKLSDEAPVRELLTELGIPVRHIVYGMIEIGYPSAAVKMPAKKENVVKYYKDNK